MPAPVDYAELVRQSGPMAVALKDQAANISDDILPLPIDAHRIKMEIDGGFPAGLDPEQRVGGVANNPRYAALRAAQDPMGLERDLTYQRYLTNADGSEAPFGPEGSIPIGEARDFSGAPHVVPHEATHLLPEVQDMSIENQHRLIRQLEAYNSGELGSSSVAAGNEYDLGARLLFDPARGHNAAQVAKSAMADPTGGRENYLTYRDMQIAYPDLLRKQGGN